GGEDSPYPEIGKKRVGGRHISRKHFFKEIVKEFNFHRYDNLKHATNKKDPRRHKYETKGLSIVNLLFSAASGDVTAMRRVGVHLNLKSISRPNYDGYFS
ncbi:unnamed protein product, partial [Timema podura]|nr:unnamed protein product [Timema podura]